MTKLQSWVDDIRVPTKGYFWTKTVKDAIIAIQEAECMGFDIVEISLDHDAGDYGPPDYIKVFLPNRALFQTELRPEKTR